VTATLLSGVLLKGETIYTLKLTRRGVRLKRGRALDVLEAVQVEEVMSETVTVLPETPLEGLDEFFLKANRNAFPVVDDGGKLIGIVSLTDVRRALESRDDIRDLCVREIMTDTLVTAFPDESLNAVLQRMAPRDLSRLPVVSRDHPDRLLGVIRRNDVVRAYDLGLARRELDAPEAPPGIRRTGHVDYIEVDLPSDSHCVGRSVAEISSELPKDSLLVSIRRVDGSVVFPRGDTVLQVGDRIVAYARKDRLEELRRCLRAPA
jgi:CIC family chloride channel protein